MSTDDRFLPQGKQILAKICQVRPMPYPKAMAFTRWTLLPNMMNENKGKWQPVSICASASKMYINILTFICTGLEPLGKNCHASSMIRTREATSQQLQLNHKYAIFVRNIVMHDFIWGVFRRLDITLFITSCTHSIRVYCWFSVSRHS